MALVYQKEVDSQSIIALWKIEEKEDVLLKKLQLNSLEREKLASLGKGKRTLHWLATRVLLRTLLDTDDYINCPSDANGKPFLPDYPYKISLTHSYEYAGIIMSKESECGIDLEIIKNKVLTIKNKFLKPEELEFIDPEKEIEQLYACWCAKEAIYKLQGNKGVSFLHNMTIHPFTYDESGTLRLDLHKGDVVKSYTVHYEKFNTYMLGYALE